ncbi:hypothetical protein Poli38472_008587 [Pythium oligandrum]|uniref:Uncharacterized protein n=1 Tax=Pythium oligandrum TaxID=41045 RepID=A0A8K1C3U9_PYTOL|nr:hypothetical protein Poli38472_008587 [Pythium oligandrum]|eukprot:TMW55939.1 hypothetical protein Poli38472_008587 [Pythium oligandrum]
MQLRPHDSGVLSQVGDPLTPTATHHSFWKKNNDCNVVGVAAGLSRALWAGVCVDQLTAPGFKVDGKHVFVTGGSSGLGLALAIKCAKQGAKISIVACTADRLEKAKKDIEAVSKHPVFIQSTDVNDLDSVQRAIDAANKFRGQPTDKVICSAGASEPGLFMEQDLSVFHKMMDANYFGVVHTVRAALPAMIKADNKAKSSSSRPRARSWASSATRNMRRPSMRINIFYPGAIDTPMFEEENRIKPAVSAAIEGSASLVPPEDCAQTLLNGLSDGYFAITNDPLLVVLRMISNGVAPRFNTALETALLPIGVLIGLGFGFWMDYIVGNERKTIAKKEKTH